MNFVVPEIETEIETSVESSQILVFVLSLQPKFTINVLVEIERGNRSSIRRKVRSSVTTEFDGTISILEFFSIFTSTFLRPVGTSERIELVVVVENCKVGAETEIEVEFRVVETIYVVVVEEISVIVGFVESDIGEIGGESFRFSFPLVFLRVLCEILLERPLQRKPHF